MNNLNNIKPKEVFDFFKQICSIPHCSKNTKQISDYLVRFAKDRNLMYYQDEVNNVIIYKNATNGYDDSPPLILQGHIDMVCDKAIDCEIDMDKEGLKLAIDADWLHAVGTSLGGDNGIAVAMILAVLDSNNIRHPKIEAVFTSDEEIGMIGAAALDISKLSAEKLLNIDSEEEGILTVSCAGGGSAICSLPIKKVTVEGNCYKILINDLKGGHSGLEIDKKRANANVLMGRILDTIESSYSMYIYNIKGGSKDNAISKSCEVEIIIDPKNKDKFKNLLEKIVFEIKDEYKISDPDIKIEIEDLDINKKNAFDTNSVLKIINFLTLCPNGVQNMSADISNLVETSINIGVIKLLDEEVNLEISIRSSKASRFRSICRKIDRLVDILDGKVEYFGLYPAWEYRENSPLRKTCEVVYKKQYGEYPEIRAIHAGLECGIFAGKMNGKIDAVSIGPTMKDVHTFDEKLSISSVERTWKFLCNIIEAS